MPRFNDFAAHTGQKNRIMCYGGPQTRKTWWAGTIAAAGYNVLFADSDGNADTLRLLPPEVQARIYYVNIQDRVDEAVAALFWTLLLRHHHIWYHESNRRGLLAEHGGATHIDIRDWGMSHVIVCDSYSSLVNSVQQQFAIENNIDLADAERQEWPGYGWCGRLLTWMLDAMGELPCHIICTAHAVHYEKKKREYDERGRQVERIEFVRRQPYSSSYPHGMTVCREFGETYYFNQLPGATMIEPFGHSLADGGSRSLPRKALKWEEFTAPIAFQKLGTPPAAEQPPPDFPVSNKPSIKDGLHTLQARTAIGPPAATPIKANVAPQPTQTGLAFPTAASATTTENPK